MAEGDELEQIRRLEDEWKRDDYERFLSRVPERRKDWRNLSGIPIKPLYTPADLPETNYREHLGFPGQFPYTRGTYPTMYRARPWTFRPNIGVGLAEDCAARYRYLLAQGVTGLALAGDFNITYSYLDPDDPAYYDCYGDVIGKTGTAMVTLRDWEILYDDLPLDKISVSLNFTDPTALAMYVAAAKRRGFALEDLQGSIESDPLQIYVGSYFNVPPPEGTFRQATDMIKFCCRHMPKWHPMFIGGYNQGEAGLTAVEELGISLVRAIAYVDAVVKDGFAVDEFAPRISFYFGANRDIFENVAKLRAARRMWARLMRDRFHAKDARSCQMRFHVQVAGCTMEARQPYNNLIRSALQGLSAVLGGAQSIHITPFDEALASPTEFSQKLSVRTHQIILNESGAADTIDPLAGSYYVEALTNEVERLAWQYIEEVEQMGGALAAIKNGHFLRQIRQSALRCYSDVQSKERVVVGVNDFVEEEVVEIETLKPIPGARERLLERLRQVRAERDNRLVQAALDKVKQAAMGTDNIMPPLIEAAEAYCTVGEVNCAFRDVWGVYRHPAEVVL